ncbi:hypothetical protein [Corynebacterium cystitidis]|uniref:hypothetical protein n=1 Tax=Corynebacterium cystitidis TaxID=35757 RepID=UPI00211EBF78|nr:hypothetical protein [Corynebacterium cystitidis]
MPHVRITAVQHPAFLSSLFGGLGSSELAFSSQSVTYLVDEPTLVETHTANTVDPTPAQIASIKEGKWKDDSHPDLLTVDLNGGIGWACNHGYAEVAETPEGLILMPGSKTEKACAALNVEESTTEFIAPSIKVQVATDAGDAPEAIYLVKHGKSIRLAR